MSNSRSSNSNVRFHRWGEEDARYDLFHAQFGDVPAALTATFSRPPTVILMEHYAEGYLETGLKLKVSSDIVKTERKRFLTFLFGRGCETGFFGKHDPDDESFRP